MGLCGLWSVKRRAQRAVGKFQFVVDNVRREKSGQNRVLKKSERVKRWLSWLYPPWKKEKGDGVYDQIFQPGTRPNSIAVLFRNILMMEVFGVIMYFLLSFKYAQYPEFIGSTISTVIHVFLMFTLIFPKLMTYFMIAIHVMITTKIKNVILILLVTMAFEGPAMNVIGNIHQVFSGVACIQNDVMSSKNDVEGNVMDKGALMVSRFRAVLTNVAGPMNKVKGMLLVMDEKVTKFIDIMRRHYRTIAGLSNQCRNMLHTPYTKCLDVFDEAYLFCKEKARFFGSHGDACDIIQKTAKICHQAKGFSTEVCSLPAIIGKGVKGAAVPFYSAYFQAIEFAVKKIFYVHIEASKWAMKKVKPVVDEMKKAKKIGVVYTSADEGKPNAADDTTANLRASIKNSLMGIVNVYIRFINIVSFILRYGVMPCLLIWPWIYTLRFMYSYNYNDDYKNKFLTDEFMKIDQDCAFRGTRKVMPLTADESKQYFWRGVWKMTEEEKPRFRVDVFITIVTCITPFFLCFLDFGVYTSLSTVHTLMNRTNIDTPAHYEMKVAGNSSMSDMMNEFLDVFSPFTKSIRDREERWRRCFQPPDPPNVVERWLMILMFILTLLLCRLKAYFGRQTLALADHFFPRRVRIRALSLYHRILQSRRNLLSEMLGNSQDVLGSEDAVIRRSMQSRGHIRSDCAKCDKYDMRVSDLENVRVCVHCGAFYCVNCFSLTLFCVRCDEEMQTVNKIELYHENDDDILLDDDSDSSQSDSESDESSTEKNGPSDVSTNPTEATESQAV